MRHASPCTETSKSMTPGLGVPSRGIKGSRQLKDRRAVPVLVAVETARRPFGSHPDGGASELHGDDDDRHSQGARRARLDGLHRRPGGIRRPAGGWLRHIALKQPLRSALRKGAPSVVPLADRAIGNLQHWLIGTYHGVSRAQLQVYLDEFVFRHNRRKQPMAAFQTLLGLGTGRTPTPYRRIRGGRDMLKLEAADRNILWSAETTG